MKKLYILGDSFSYPHKTEKKLWPVLAAEYLEHNLNEKIEIVNQSIIGASQDYVWRQLDKVLSEITSNDFLIIVLTSSDRFWFFEDRPEHSNIASIRNVQQVAGSDIELQNAVWGFITKIWRSSLAQQLQEHRLGYLAYHVLSKNLKNPIILKAFEDSVIPEEKYTNLLFSKHSLAKIQLEEFEKFEGLFSGGDVLMAKEYWHHLDCRYNHMCLSNHIILGKLVGESLHNNVTIDLGSDEFHKKLITTSNCKNKEFAAKEFSIKYFNEVINNKVRQTLGAKSFRLFF